jgi:hypothetical protein
VGAPTAGPQKMAAARRGAAATKRGQLCGALKAVPNAGARCNERDKESAQSVSDAFLGGAAPTGAAAVVPPTAARCRPRGARPRRRHGGAQHAATRPDGGAPARAALRPGRAGGVVGGFRRRTGTARKACCPALRVCGGKEDGTVGCGAGVGVSSGRVEAAVASKIPCARGGAARPRPKSAGRAARAAAAAARPGHRAGRAPAAGPRLGVPQARGACSAALSGAAH